MPNDRETSELISMSLSGVLSSSDQHRFREGVAGSDESRQFQTISRLIQDSLSDVARRSADGDPHVAPGLSDQAKNRLRDSMRLEQTRLSRPGGTAAVATGSTFRPDSADKTAGPDEVETRQMTTRFQIQRQLGAGALGVVWLARDEKLKRSVALKEMNAEAAEFPRAWHRFCREAEITGYLEHPNIVQLYQFGSDPVTGQPFYAMRFVGKRTLAEAIDEYHDRRESGEDTSMDLHKLLIAFLGVCQALAYAHSRGVIHRDLKPENVALDNFGQVIVLDWGLARLTDEFEAGNLLSGDGALSDSGFEKTMAGEIIGTPIYMAPEQAAGDQDNVDERADVYGLGAILFAMLTGKAPHSDRSRDDGGVVAVDELLRRIAAEPSPDPGAGRDDLPSGLVSICSRALRLKRHSRFQTAAELADAVERWLAGRTERRQLYGNMQSEGRELRTNMLNFIRNLERNVRFMSSLPPIQEISGAIRNSPAAEDLRTWRQRLSVIYRGLLQTNNDFCAVSFCQVTDNEYREIVRIERQQGDTGQARSVPASRLASGPLTDCQRAIMDGHPQESTTSFQKDCRSDGREAPSGFVISAVPVFDEQTEEPFGFVMIEACLMHVVEGFLRHRLKYSDRAFVLNNDYDVLMQINKDGSLTGTCDGEPASSICSKWAAVIPNLRERGEYVDEQTHSVYATRVDLVPGKSSLSIVLLNGAG
ncbi:MAG: serine/threonine-protein kinase [Planctomycetaceae bacterium]